MIQTITHNNITYATIIKQNYVADGIKFFTPAEYSQQLAYMNRPKGHKIIPHTHKRVERTIFYTQEVLFIKSGKVRVDFYHEDQTFFESTILETGDVILLAQGGHGFEMLEPTEIIEVKQGPFGGDDDKIRFDGI